MEISNQMSAGTGPVEPVVTFCLVVAKQENAQNFSGFSRETEAYFLAVIVATEGA